MATDGPFLKVAGDPLQQMQLSSHYKCWGIHDHSICTGNGVFCFYFGNKLQVSFLLVASRRYIVINTFILQIFIIHSVLIVEAECGLPGRWLLLLAALPTQLVC